MQDNFSQIAIIGLGPAGMAAVNQFKRYHKMPRVFTRHEPGGILKNAHIVENYLGFSSGIAANTLIDQFTQALLHLKDKIICQKVIQVDYLLCRKYFSIKTNTAQYFSKYLIIATGTQAKPLNCNILTRLQPYIYDEPHPLFDIGHKKIVILGSGDAACVYALKLAKKNDVHWYIRGKKLKAIPALLSAIKKNGIAYRTGMEVSSIEAGEKLSLKIILNNTYEVNANYLIPAIGREPALSFMTKNLICYFEQGLLNDQLYFAGDVRNDRYRQIAIAAGDGVKAAMQIYQSMARI